MVTVLPPGRTRPSLAEGASNALRAGIETYGKFQQAKRASEEYESENDTYKGLTGRNLSKNPKIREKEIEYALKGEYDLKRGETPLQKAQRLKLEHELEQSKGEEDYFSRLTGLREGREDENAPWYEKTAEGETKPWYMQEFGEEPRSKKATSQEPKKAPAAKFNLEDPKTWSSKEINSFRAYQGQNPKGKSLAKQAQNEFDQRQESKKIKTKYQESVGPLEGALEVLDQMEAIGRGGRLGIGTTARGLISPKTRKDAGEYERLGKSLISYSTNIPIRNRMEFETLAHDLYDPSISDASREGILNAMKRIIQNSIKSYSVPEEEGRESPQARRPTQQERPPLTSFLR